MYQGISPKDIRRLRNLAARQMEIARSDGMQKLYADWMRHGSFEKNARPMLTVEMWTFADEILPAMLQCESEAARELEKTLLMNVIPYTVFGDDTPVRDYFPVTLEKSFVPLGLEVRKECAGDEGYVGVGHRWDTYLHDLEEDFGKIGKSRFSVSVEKTQRRVDEISELFGDILPVRRAGEPLGLTLAEDIIHLMKMEDLYVAMLETPELVHKMIDMLARDYDEYITYMEGFDLLPTASDEPLWQGSYCFTNLLPSTGHGLKAGQVWGYMDAEEMNDVSPEMYRDFIVEHYIPLTARFGALSFGCCEAIHRFWDNSVERLPNLRKVSVSAWCDVRFMGERLRGRDIVLFRKPSANMLGVRYALDEDETRGYYKETAEAASGCRLEIAQRDVYLLHGNIDKVHRYVEIAKETIEKYWKP